MPTRRLPSDLPDLPPLPELSPRLQTLADELIQEGPLGLISLFGYILNKTGQDPQWNEILSEAFRSAGLAEQELYDAAADLDDGLVYKVKITLRGSRPTILREVEVPNMTLGELHEIIQMAMGWEDSHPHCYTVDGEEYGELHPDAPYDAWLDEESVSLGELVKADTRKFIYEYDFGDAWTHEILISPPKAPKAGVFYPRCIKGELACPPEDCGGVFGYLKLCALLQKPKAEWSSEEKERMEWIGKYDPAAFKLEDVNADLVLAYAPPDVKPKKPSKAKAKKK